MCVHLLHIQFSPGKNRFYSELQKYRFRNNKPSGINFRSFRNAVEASTSIFQSSEQFLIRQRQNILNDLLRT